MIDLRTLSPIDWDTVIESVEATGRLVVVDEANPRCSIACDVARLRGPAHLRRAEGGAADGDGAARLGAVLAGAGGHLRALGRLHRRRGRADLRPCARPA